MRLGKVERSVLMEVARIHGNNQEGISDHGPGTAAAIDRLQSKGLISGYNSWEITEAGREALASISE